MASGIDLQLVFGGDGQRGARRGTHHPRDQDPIGGAVTAAGEARVDPPGQLSQLNPRGAAQYLGTVDGGDERAHQIAATGLVGHVRR